MQQCHQSCIPRTIRFFSLLSDPAGRWYPDNVPCGYAGIAGLRLRHGIRSIIETTCSYDAASNGSAMAEFNKHTSVAVSSKPYFGESWPKGFSRRGWCWVRLRQKSDISQGRTRLRPYTVWQCVGESLIPHCALQRPGFLLLLLSLSQTA